MELFDYLTLAPRRLRALLPIGLVVAIHFFPGPTEELLWARVKAETQQATSLLRTAIDAGVHRRSSCARTPHCGH
jgi:hypothetical protein